MKRYSEITGQVDAHVGSMVRHGAAGAVGAAGAATAAHFGVGGLALNPTTVVGGAAAGVAVSVAADLLLRDERVYRHSKLQHLEMRRQATLKVLAQERTAEIEAAHIIRELERELAMA